ncbi:uncharacterized protein [Dermacentor albipictus]|uniref:uncharacterized protein isoform X2 n=1 Tax=Dermacentor albipictus TaxID=60249 RepID=UPI0031FBD834
MFVDTIILAGLAVLVAAQPEAPVPLKPPGPQIPQVPQVPQVPKVPPRTTATKAPPGPPRDTNPDCAALREKVPGHLYHNCTFICEGDQDFVLRDGQSCFVADPLDEMPVRGGVRTVTGDMGTCKDGKCVLLQSVNPPAMPETPRPRPPSDVSPDCHRPNTTDYVFEKCSFVCEGDQDFTMYNKELCILPGQSSSGGTSSVEGSVAAFVTGVCVDGKCVLEDTLAPPQKPGKPAPPRDTNPDCNAWKTNQRNYLYHNCTFICEGDEEVLLKNRQSCVLQATPQSPRRNGVNGALGSVDMGVCLAGRCVQPNEITPQMPKFPLPGPPSDINPDCYRPSSTEYIFQNCSFICEKDEAFRLNNSEKCTLQGQSPTAISTSSQGGTAAFVTGVCKEGKCVLPGGAPPQKTARPEPPRETNPDCKSWRNNLSKYRYRSCTFVCGEDEEVSLKNNERCILPDVQSPSIPKRSTKRDKAPKGVCNDGKCVPKRKKTTPSIVKSTIPPPPWDRNPDCNATMAKVKGYVYHNCTFDCEKDEEILLKDKEPCILQQGQVKPPVPSLTQQTSWPKGVCQDGVCVPQGTKKS